MIRLYTCLLLLTFFAIACDQQKSQQKIETLRTGFLNPPDSSRPGVYWYFMDGNMSRPAITEDLEAMRAAGIGYVIFLEVNVGVPRGKLDFFSDQWQELFAYAVHEAKRIGITVTLGIGPGWTGSGGPWVSGKESMQHLVASSVTTQGGNSKRIVLPIPKPVKPYFGEAGLGAELHKKWNDYFQDVAVLAYPAMQKPAMISQIMEKANFYRAPFSSVPNTAPYLSEDTTADSPGNVIHRNQIIDLTDSVKNGVLNCSLPKGEWTIMRFAARNNGAVTRPAPLPGVGFEADKFDTTALNAHLDHYVGKLLNKIGNNNTDSAGGLKMLHIDSWEMGAQNWTAKFREEFIKRRGYDPLPFYPVYQGLIVDSKEISERFLWDLRFTAQQLVIENHANHVKQYAHRAGLQLSIEPYDMNPTADLELGRVGDIPMCEFWSRNMGFNTAFSTIEASSIGHIEGKPVVAAEAFTSCDRLAWMQFPGAMKNQSDWAFAVGINKFYFHTFQHQPLDKRLKPGMTMGPCGIHWNRNQTFWPMVGEYHNYVARCQYLLQQGKSNADILYLTPEGAPHVFQPPHSALSGDSLMPDRKQYNFDGCSPSQLLGASVRDKQIVFPSGAAYRVIVLPQIESMSLELLNKTKELLNAGATIIGTAPTKAKGLTGFPDSDEKVKKMAAEIWSAPALQDQSTEKKYGNGLLVYGGAFQASQGNLYPDYEPVVQLLNKEGVAADLVADSTIRYTHRTLDKTEIYFVSNKTDRSLALPITFRATGHAELWQPVTGATGKVFSSETHGHQTTIDLSFHPYESYFIVFTEDESQSAAYPTGSDSTLYKLSGAWTVSFDTSWGGPAKINFDTLSDWRNHPDSGVRYYSGIAAYKKSFDFPVSFKGKLYLDLGNVKNLARVKLNGKSLGVVWTNPWRVNITNAIQEKDNRLEIEVANLWINRMIGDDSYPDDGVKNGQWPVWLLENKPRQSKRWSFVTNEEYHRSDTLMPSGLLGPVVITGEPTQR